MKKLFYFAAFLLLFACGNDDDGATPLPTLNYSNTELEANMGIVGSSSIPNVNWNGDVGSFAIAQNIDQLSINTSTGQLNWTKLLLPGIYEFTVLATNRAGTAEADIILSNPMSTSVGGSFRSSVNNWNDGLMEMEFNRDGSLEVEYLSNNPTGIFTGSWEFDGDNIIGSFSNGDGYNFVATFRWENGFPVVTGTQYFGDTIPANKIGTFTLSII